MQEEKVGFYFNPLRAKFFKGNIYIIITKNICYLLWNRGAWRFFLDTYLKIEVQRIRCTNHLHDSCPLTDVNPHFTAPGCQYYSKINSWWPIVTSLTHGPAASYCDVTMAHCSHGYLWTRDVEVDASWRDCDNQRKTLNCLAQDFIILQFLGLTSLFTFLFIFGPRVSTRGIASRHIFTFYVITPHWYDTGT